jgi:hypothetical protein
MSAQNADTALSQIEACEATIRRLVDKLSEAKDRRVALAREIERHSFAAHTEDDPAAKKKISDLSRAALSADQDAESIEAALHTARLRLEEAQVSEQQAETKKTANEARADYKWLITNGPRATEHAVALSLLLEEAKNRIDRIHTRGYSFPTSMQWISMVSRGISTLIMTLPIRNFEHSFLPPNQRVDLGRVLHGWGTTGLRNIDEQFPGGNKQQKQDTDAHAAA